ncbi:uncharacterized protein BO88DRAFT_247913 [Aspergillus vadensis CBS 113365]|uniref:Uncharacterized protein n=1 Tax=Aspergillus vadensis (strain CBS 113365 / IMI 142717 / IBT 24658) TaxID=1448311 RepID=A0A319BF06_ASPVC|nr:hypothetical protein BO88DRAFT_247913 [Aspergillus vadensis CBS 113365]PYH71247.1 hypothetical protein BO88DRAFT_247913 [Aspergillus vadensis CBS 113365]
MDKILEVYHQTLLICLKQNQFAGISATAAAILSCTFRNFASNEKERGKSQSVSRNFSRRKKRTRNLKPHQHARIAPKLTPGSGC